jgi:hypothetical protein
MASLIVDPSSGIGPPRTFPGGIEETMGGAAVRAN